MIRLRLFGAICFVIILVSFQPISDALDEKESQAKKSVVQNVGGLLFDVDEGVKIEQGSGGSVYLKSNREAVQARFESIESRLDELEKRMQEIESLQEAAPSQDEQPEGETSSKRVFIT